MDGSISIVNQNEEKPPALRERAIETQGAQSRYPASELHTPPSLHHTDQTLKLGALNVDSPDLDVEASGGEQQKAESATSSTVQTLAEKRKMKRFRSVSDCKIGSRFLISHRLIHSQTRFLLNEYALQPHPDATHRARLSQEIPGLSPRQVQVWFQNRHVDRHYRQDCESDE